MGLAKMAFTPVGRGFNSSLGYLGGAEDHYAHKGGGGIDLWASDRPAVGHDGVYSAFLYARHAEQLILSHPHDRGLLLYHLRVMTIMIRALGWLRFTYVLRCRC
eukprot:COSAG01_NODE_4683_length_4818_cov_2.240305_3_plen_104_part_00